MCLCKFTFVIVLYFCSIPLSQAQQKWFVDKANGSDIHSGLSWAQSLQHLQTALLLSEQDDTIWVAAGTYYPDEGSTQTNDDRNSRFFIVQRHIYGGFAGFEQSISERNLEINHSILSGDLQQNDQPNFQHRSDNAYHVVYAHFAGTPTLNGLTIEGGNANGAGFDINGAGLSLFTAEATLEYCTIRDNNCIGSGAGLAHQNSNARAIIKHSIFENNKADGVGGAMSITINNKPEIEFCIFERNQAASGAAVSVLSSNPSFLGCKFINNSILEDSTIINTGGGISALSNSFMFIFNCSFEGNSAQFGGGMYISGSDALIININVQSNFASGVGGGMYVGGGEIGMTHGTFSGNSALVSGGGIYAIANAELTIYNTVIWNNMDNSGIGSANASLFENLPDSLISINYSLIQNVSTATNNNLEGLTNAADTNYPEFISICDPNMAPMVSGSPRLKTSSLLINAGDDTQSFLNEDVDRLDRMIGIVDIGAFENPFIVCNTSLEIPAGYSPLSGIIEAIQSISIQSGNFVNAAGNIELNATEVVILPDFELAHTAQLEISNSGCSN